MSSPRQHTPELMVINAQTTCGMKGLINANNTPGDVSLRQVLNKRSISGKCADFYANVTLLSKEGERILIHSRLQT